MFLLSKNSSIRLSSIAVSLVFSFLCLTALKLLDSSCCDLPRQWTQWFLLAQLLFYTFGEVSNSIVLFKAFVSVIDELFFHPQLGHVPPDPVAPHTIRFPFQSFFQQSSQTMIRPNSLWFAESKVMPSPFFPQSLHFPIFPSFLDYNAVYCDPGQNVCMHENKPYGRSQLDITLLSRHVQTTSNLTISAR